MSGKRQKYEKFSHIILFSCTVFRIWQNPASLSACDYASAGILLFLPYLDCFTNCAILNTPNIARFTTTTLAPAGIEYT